MSNFVKSPYWPDNSTFRMRGINVPDNVNPFFPKGCSKRDSHLFLKRETVFISKENTVKNSAIKKAERAMIKRMKQECINKNVSTIFTNKLN